ncbi:MAG TPA: hypothetical protein VJH87_21320 [Vicinamibacteria bacterium]|nr:hypothetical protein [Vicinamibacteria bacterium]
MPVYRKPVRRSVSLPPSVARRVRTLAKTNRTSTNRTLVELIESGLEAQERGRRRFLELADRLTQSRDKSEQSRLKEELARMTFGE